MLGRSRRGSRFTWDVELRSTRTSGGGCPHVAWDDQLNLTRKQGAPTFAGARRLSERVDQVKLHALEVRLLLPRRNSGCQYGVLQVAVQGATVYQKV